MRLIVERHAVVLEVFMGLVLHNPLIHFWIIGIVKEIAIVRSALEPSHPSILVEILEPRPTQAYVKTECINRVCGYVPVLAPIFQVSVVSILPK